MTIPTCAGGGCLHEPGELLEPTEVWTIAHRNEEAGIVWLNRIKEKFPDAFG